MQAMEVLRGLRDRFSINQAQAADIAGVAKSTYVTWEHGSLPKVDGAIKLSEYYGVSLDYLYGREIQKTEAGISSDEERLLTGYKVLSAAEQDAILKMVVDLVFAKSAK